MIKQSGNRAKRGKDRLYSLHAPEIECIGIGKGKARTPWEFGCKVSVLVTAKEKFFLASDAQHGNTYDGHILQSTVVSACATTGEVLPATLVDRGYKGVEKTPFTEVHITGRKKGKDKVHEQQNRRNTIEAVIGDMKTDGLLSRNRLLVIYGLLTPFLTVDPEEAPASFLTQNMARLVREINQLA
ncbi:MAG: hypothetical protein LAT66_02315 [Alkalimonas sp.]|nr:hypothetical protein [Alkalimonas sp.]